MSDPSGRRTAVSGPIGSGVRVLVASLLLAGCLLVAGSLLGTDRPTTAGVGASAAMAAEPTATPGQGGDPRSPGEGPGFVGDPLLAIGGVVLVGIASVLATLAYVRLTDLRRS